MLNFFRITRNIKQAQIISQTDCAHVSQKFWFEYSEKELVHTISLKIKKFTYHD